MPFFQCKRKTGTQNPKRVEYVCHCHTFINSDAILQRWKPNNPTKCHTRKEKHQARGFAIMFDHYGGSGLDSNGAFLGHRGSLVSHQRGGSPRPL